MRTIIGAGKLFLYGLWSCVMIPPQFILILFTGGPITLVMPRFFHIVACKIFGLECVITGAPMEKKHVVFVGNHLSYLDIPTMGVHFYGSFIAKQDVAGWFLFGLLAKLSRTLFISRQRSQAAYTRKKLDEALVDGRPLVLFAEGTSSDGSQVLPFKSSLFESVIGTEKSLKVQPFTLLLDSVDGRPVRTQADRDHYAWYGDMELEPHLWAFAKSKGARLILHVHPARDPAAYDNRKDLARDCHADSASGLALDFAAKAA